MKKLLFVAVIGALVACGESTSETPAVDTAAVAVDTTAVTVDTTVAAPVDTTVKVDSPATK